MARRPPPAALRRPLSLRAGDASSVAVITTKAINGMQADPLREHRFASFSDDGVIKIWDARKLSHGPVSCRAHPPPSPSLLLSRTGEADRAVGETSC